MAIAMGQTVESVKRMAEILESEYGLTFAMDRLVEAYKRRDEAFAQLGLLAKRQKRQEPRKSYESPYAKFDRKRRKRK